MASIIRRLREQRRDFLLVHTGQHYDFNMSKVFFEDLELPVPDINLKTGSGTQASQTAAALVSLERAFRKISPDVVLVEGDTNTVLAAALAAAKMRIKVGHVEAGLRSFDLRMPEEHNRRITDHLSAYLFAPTRKAANTLKNEAVWGEIRITGNTAIDACLMYTPKALRLSRVLETIPFRRFALATAHRAENVDDPEILKELFEIFTRCPVPVVYPIHPRARMRFQSVGLYRKLSASRNVALIPPAGYLDFLALLSKCAFVMTDSGGIQEEATAPNLKKRVFVLRTSTERPEAVEAGYAEVVGTQPKRVLSRVQSFLAGKWNPRRSSPFGDGSAGHQIVDFLFSG